MKRRVVELGKNLAILLLAALAVFLLILSNFQLRVLTSPTLDRLLSPLAELMGIEHTELPPLAPAQSSAAEAARPVAISICNESGRNSILGDADALQTAYLMLGPMLGEALDTASDGHAIAQSAYLSALAGESVCFLYQVSMPVGTLANWLGADSTAGDRAAIQLLLSVEEGAVVLYLADDGVYWRYVTRARAEVLQQLLNVYLPDGSAFAFESTDPVLRSLAPTTLLAEDVLPHALSVSTPASTTLSTQVLESLGINAYGTSAYQDGTGALIYNESGFNLRIGADGTVTLSNQTDGTRFTANNDTLTAKIELARALLGDITESQTGAAQLQLSSWEESENGALTITFDYLVDSLPLTLSQGHAATVVFHGTRLTNLELYVRCYTIESGTLPLIPVRQAAALVPAGSNLYPGYADTNGNVSVGWQCR